MIVSKDTKKILALMCVFPILGSISLALGDKQTAIGMGILFVFNLLYHIIPWFVRGWHKW